MATAERTPDGRRVHDHNACERYMARETRRADKLAEKLQVVSLDLVRCVNTLLVICGDATTTPEKDARDTLRLLARTVECPFCEGIGVALCGKCKGGGTREHPCEVCGNVHDVPCRECLGKGEL